MSEQRWALVTGASGELGQAISLTLAARNIPLYVHYHQGAERIEPIVSACREMGVPCIPLQADLRDPFQIHRLFEGMPIKPLFVINNASIDHIGLFQDVSPQLFDEMIAINVRSAFLVSQAAVPAMLMERFGRIVNIASIWGLTGSACEVLYSLTKGAVLAFTKALAKELAPNGITVNAVAPGAVAGGMMTRFTAEEINAICHDIPMGRLGLPEEIASLVAYLLAPEAGYVTGQAISSNGGWYT